MKSRFFANNRLGLFLPRFLAAFGCWIPRPHLSAIPSTLVHELSSSPPERQFAYSMLVRHLHVQRCSNRTRLLPNRSHIRTSKTPTRDGPFVARRRELREQKARSSDCCSRTAKNDFCEGVMSAGPVPSLWLSRHLIQQTAAR